MYSRNIYFLIKITAILILGTGLGFYLLKKKNETFNNFNRDNNNYFTLSRSIIGK